MAENNDPVGVDVGQPVEPDDQESLMPSVKTSEFPHPIGEPVDLSELEGDPGSIFERLIDENDLLPVWFLVQGAVVQRAIGRVVLTKAHGGLGPGNGWATGFMVSPTLFLTNNHVIPNKAFSNKIRMQFNYQRGPDGMDLPTESYFPAADDVFHTNPGLDYTLIRLRPNQEVEGAVQAGDRWGFVPLNDSPTYREEQHFNIVQHPSGRQKEVALQDNELAELFDMAVRYQADTEPGSSGSPVFDNLWQLVALHHAGGEQDAHGKWLNNQGIRIDAIIDDLRQHFTDIGREEILDELGIS